MRRIVWMLCVVVAIAVMATIGVMIARPDTTSAEWHGPEAAVTAVPSRSLGCGQPPALVDQASWRQTHDASGIVPGPPLRAGEMIAVAQRPGGDTWAMTRDGAPAGDLTEEQLSRLVWISCRPVSGTARDAVDVYSLDERERRELVDEAVTLVRAFTEGEDAFWILRVDGREWVGSPDALATAIEWEGATH